jgi:hypothetical protein
MPAETSSVDGWRRYLAAHAGDVSLWLEDGRGTVVAHRADQPQPLASAVKVLHLLAYARAVAAGRARPDEPVRVADWDRWYLPGTDGGAHPNALARLGVASGGVATLDQLVSAMIELSDNAAADLLRDRLGDDALRAAAAAVGWIAPDLPSILGSMLIMIDPGLAALSGTRAQRDATEVGVARRYAADPGFRGRVRKNLPPLPVQQAWADTTWAASAGQLARLHWSVETGSCGAGADLARRHLEWQPSRRAGIAGVGFKGGSLPGVLTEAMNLRRADGTVATAVLLVRRMSIADGDTARTTYAHQQLLVEAMLDPGQARLLRGCFDPAAQA